MIRRVAFGVTPTRRRPFIVVMLVSSRCEPLVTGKKLVSLPNGGEGNVTIVHQDSADT